MVGVKPIYSIAMSWCPTSEWPCNTKLSQAYKCNISRQDLSSCINTAFILFTKLYNHTACPHGVWSRTYGIYYYMMMLSLWATVYQYATLITNTFPKAFHKLTVILKLTTL